MKLAAIDIGSNAVRLLITEVFLNGSAPKYRKRLFVRVPLRLGQDAFTNQKISAEKAEKLVRAMTSFKTLIDLFGVKHYLACGTAALRESANGDKIAEAIRQEAGVKLDIVDGKREAEIIYSCHVAEKLNHNRSYLYIDVGGGSTELTLFSQKKIVFSGSFPAGSIRLLYDKVSVNTWDQMKETVKEICRDHGPLTGIGTGGNINKLCKLNDTEKRNLSYKELKEMHGELSEMTLEQRIKKYGFNEDRADVIVPAAKIYLSVMKWADIEELHVPKLGLADGLINLLYEKHQPASA